MENKKKLIYADDLDEKLRNVVRRNCSGGGSIAVSDGVCMALTLLREAVPVDAVEVVRCKDCKHVMHSAIYKQYFCTNIYGLRNVCRLSDDFCSYGERREGE